MSISFIGFTLDVLGKLLVAYTTIRVHHRFRMEHKIDKRVFTAMRLEQTLGFIGIALIILGYFLQLPSKLHP
jgi:uncharacterized membrane protein